uniref:Uncharacterized protein n=1 Tax=viral metagenome TaxID=1070528 RepID=A0A6C0KTY2_9ZZZZ
MKIETVIIILLLFTFLLALYLKKFLGAFFIILLLILYCGYLYYASTIKENFQFFFRDDDENVAHRPEIYCGDAAALPTSYDVMGTRYRCLQKGVGTGMMLPNYRRDEFLARPRPPPGERIYCGNAAALPAGYARFGLKSQCLKKGVGIGLAMTPAKRAAAQARARRPPGKKELMDLAERFGVTTGDKTRNETLEAIADKLERMTML